MYHTLCNSGSSRYFSGRYGIRQAEARSPKIVWSLLISETWPSLMLMWLGTWTNGASAAVTTASASPTGRPSFATIWKNRSAVRGWSRSKMASVRGPKYLSWLISARLRSIAGTPLVLAGDSILQRRAPLIRR